MAVQSSRRNEKMKRRRWGGGGRARRTIFNYAENALAEMATVLRKDATILIRLREKMDVQKFAENSKFCENYSLF